MQCVEDDGVERASRSDRCQSGDYHAVTLGKLRVSAAVLEQIREIQPPVSGDSQHPVQEAHNVLPHQVVAGQRRQKHRRNQRTMRRIQP
jgi:hypothetical protein